jgi:glycosyltransferase involved in cell wall biosynthesis
MPLSDDEWSKGKCGYKLIQYMAVGRPAIGTPTAANVSILDGGNAGLLAVTPEEWYRALVRLRDNEALRDLIGAAGRARVERKYCLDVTAKPLTAALLKAAGRSCGEVYRSDWLSEPDAFRV